MQNVNHKIVNHKNHYKFSENKKIDVTRKQLVNLYFPKISFNTFFEYSKLFLREYFPYQIATEPIEWELNIQNYPWRDSLLYK